MSVITVVTLRWYQPIREFLDNYLGVELAAEAVIEPEDSMLLEQDAVEATEFTRTMERAEADEIDHDSGGSRALSDLVDSGVPITLSTIDPYVDRNPIYATRFQLQFALLAVKGSGDLTLAADALAHARAIASANRMNLKFIDAVDQALLEVNQLSELDLAFIQRQLDELSELMVSMGRVEMVGETGVEPATTIRVSEQPEEQSFWGEISDGISNIYKVRRIAERRLAENVLQKETGTQLRLLLFLERARKGVRTYDVDAYRESLDDALQTLDAVGPVISNDHQRIRDELLELASIELVSPYSTIGAALGMLAGETSTLTSDVGVQSP